MKKFNCEYKAVQIYCKYIYQDEFLTRKSKIKLAKKLAANYPQEHKNQDFLAFLSVLEKIGSIYYLKPYFGI